jgi:hypothetical protein
MFQKYYFPNQSKRFSIDDWIFFSLVFSIFLICIFIFILNLLSSKRNIYLLISLLISILFFGILTWISYPNKIFFIKYTKEYLIITDSRALFPFFRKKIISLNNPIEIKYFRKIFELIIVQNQKSKIRTIVKGLNNEDLSFLLNLLKSNSNIKLIEYDDFKLYS